MVITMKYTNPIIKGFYPDPSVCRAQGKYYLVSSSFQYFPGVPLFESTDLVNWRQIGHVLTRKSQVMLDKVRSSGGVFAPTIRCHNGRFYMVTNNNSTQQNFYVYTDDIYGEWSDPVYVDQDGIDPSLLFDRGHTYFISNGSDDRGESGIVQCEIDIHSGKKLSESKCIWHGSGGRYLESPHMYCINGTYYLMAAEGGTEYGHMITYARSASVWGPFEEYASNPVLTNRNKAPELIQGIGHGDLIQDACGNWHILCLGFRQIHLWKPFHTLGREVFLVPVQFDDKGWFTAGKDGSADSEYEIAGDFLQEEKRRYTFDNTAWHIDWCYLRHPDPAGYELSDHKAILHGSTITLDDADSPTFLGLRQRDFSFTLSSRLSIDGGEAGICVYSCEHEHYEAAIRKSPDGFEAILRLNIGDIKHIQHTVKLPDGCAKLILRADSCEYRFSIIREPDSQDPDGHLDELLLGSAQSKYLSSEVSEGFTGVVLGLYAVYDNTAEFTDFELIYH